MARWVGLQPEPNSPEARAGQIKVALADAPVERKDLIAQRLEGLRILSFDPVLELISRSEDCRVWPEKGHLRPQVCGRMRAGVPVSIILRLAWVPISIKAVAQVPPQGA